MCVCVCVWTAPYTAFYYVTTPPRNATVDSNKVLSCFFTLFFNLSLPHSFICFSSFSPLLLFCLCFLAHMPLFPPSLPLCLLSLSGIGFKGAANQLLINTEFLGPFVCTVAPVCDTHPLLSLPFLLPFLSLPLSSRAPSLCGDEWPTDCRGIRVVTVTCALTKWS